MMSASNWCSVLVVLTIAAGLRPLGAQSVAGASIEGTVADANGHPVAGAEVILRHPATGATYSTISRADGRYRLDVVPVDGPYTLLARSIG
jgi:hypothetical protein